ncbi:MAG: pyruvate, phosphate dikinase, partial [Candidatus Lokiarchaeota archaeon]|nr:pyruvate, phosphate dikinase [Candidatus Lokiarchaeota archaeon]
MNLNKKVYLFGEGNKDLKGLLGGKGANLSEMTNMGLPVPPGFTITTEVCIDYSKRGAIVYNEIESLVWEYIKELEKKTGKIFGDPQADAPLLVSVRSGAKFSMPGMMDTILNLGLNDQIIKNFARYMGDSRVAYDCYRRFIQMFSNVVLGIKGEKFEEILSEFKNAKKVKLDIQLDTEDLEELVKKYKSIVLNSTGKEFPDDPKTQLKMAIIAVFESWNNPRAQTYRKLNNIPDDLGTAVNVQVMVYGNAGNDSATGVGFTRNPSTGQRILYGEFLQNAQGEDVVAGIRTPRDVHELKAIFPEIFVQILNISNRLEAHYKDVQDFEFSIEKGILYMLQTRDAKRTAQSAVKTAVEMMKEGFISKQEAILRVKSDQIEQLLHYQIDPNEKNLHILTKGLNASPGAAKGNVVFSADDAVKWAQEGRNVILVSPETTPDDIHGMAVAQGILTQHGGMTSHAAVVARAMGKPCVAGAEEISINIEEKFFTINDHLIKEGTTITINGTTGDVILGGAPLIEPEYSGEFKELLSYADEYRDLKIRTNADTPKFAQNALKFGAEGIGLCRTERMFNDPDRLPVVQQMILAKTKEQRLEYLKKLEVMQRKDFLEIFKIMSGLPVTIRLLDLPLH